VQRELEVGAALSPVTPLLRGTQPGNTCGSLAVARTVAVSSMPSALTIGTLHNSSQIPTIAASMWK